MKTPISKEEIINLKIGDLVYLSGLICTGRDQAHKRIIKFFETGKELPELFEKIRNSGIFHVGPIVKQEDNKKYTIISAGPTTSARMNPFQTKVNQILDSRFVIGKGGMKNVNWHETNSVFLQYPGGAGAIVSKFIQNVVGVEWLDLGLPEAVWFLEVSEFGPLVVAQDSHCGSLYEKK